MLTTIALLRSHLLYVLLILSAIKFVKLYLYFIYIYIYLYVNIKQIYVIPFVNSCLIQWLLTNDDKALFLFLQTFNMAIVEKE